MTAKEIYAILVLDAGIPPEYVLDKMAFYEVDAILEKLYYRHRESWDQTRFISYVMAQSHSTKRIKPADLVKFPWDKDQDEPANSSINQEDIERLKKESEEYIKSKTICPQI